VSDVPSSPQPALSRAFNSFDRERLFIAFFFAAYFFLIYQLVLILTPFMAPLIAAVMLALVAYPVHRIIHRTVREPNVAATVTTLLIMFTVVVPMSILIWLLLREAAAVIPVVRDWLLAHRDVGAMLVQLDLPEPLAPFAETLRGYVERFELDLAGIALDTVRQAGNEITRLGASLVAKFFVVLLHLIVLMFALFFFLRDGPHLVCRVVELVPMEETGKQVVLAGLDRILVAMLRGTVVTASAQGALTGIGLALFGVPFPVLLGFAATFLAVVPFVGASLVWFPAAVYLFVNEQTMAAVGLTLWGLVLVGLIDNVLRPVVIGEHAQLPILLLFLGVLGGIQIYGLIGALISPMVIACLFAFAHIYREQYLARSRTLLGQGDHEGGDTP
jgi:predicted PurR-regulated permease PerM